MKLTHNSGTAAWLPPEAVAYRRQLEGQAALILAGFDVPAPPKRLAKKQMDKLERETWGKVVKIRVSR